MKNAKIIFFVVFVAVSVFIIYFFDYKRDNTINKILDKNAKQITLEFDSIYKKHKLFAEMIFDSYINNRPLILSTIALANTGTNTQKTILRKELYSLLSKEYLNLSSLVNLRQLHFHLKNNESFLRMHKPSKFGDDLTFVRPAVAYVNKYKKPIDGFEEGRIYNGFRFIYPLFFNHKHIGSVEVSYSSYEIISDLLKDYNIASNLLINTKVVQEKVFQDQKSNYIQSPIQGYSYDKEVVKKLKQKFKLEGLTLYTTQEIIKKIPHGTPFSLYDKNNQIITIIPQKNPVTHKFIAAFIIKSSAEGIRSVNENFYFLIAFSLFLLFIIIYFFYTKYAYDFKLELQNRQMKAILNSEAVITILLEEDKIVIANRAFFEFFDNFKNLEEFQKARKCLCMFFENIPDDTYVQPTKNINTTWIHQVIKNPRNNYKVCIKKEGFLHHFAIKIGKVRKKFGNKSFVISLLDITNEITMRENIQTILNSQDNMLVIIDENMHLTYANQKFFSLLDISNIEEFYNKFEFLSDIFLKDKRFFFPEEKQNWIKELLKLQEEQRITSIIDQKDFSQKAFILKPVYLEKTKSYLCSFTEYTKLALETQNLSKKAYTDALTNIPNRAKFNEDLHKEIEYFERYNSPFCLALFDIDLFKHVNDTYGHDIGDKILQELASLVSTKIRTTDIIARWGEEEFVIILNQTSVQEAFSIAETLRKSIEQNIFTQNLKITCSFGISQVVKKDTQKTLFKRVDEALYEAKRSGRNCTKMI
jgi:diguanylate cyclase (GGDEF)-like protein